MRVLMLSWEYPPFVVGGIAAHVDGLARAMARQGHDVVVCTLQRHEPGSPDVPDDEIVDGVRVLRATADLPWLPEGDLVARMASANHQGRARRSTRRLASRGGARPRLAGVVGRRYAEGAVRRPARGHGARHRARPPRRPRPAGHAGGDQRRRVVAHVPGA
ncbi:MAG: glycogen/starch synthase [Ilumatobacteraceae bacterium]